MISTIHCNLSKITVLNLLKGILISLSAKRNALGKADWLEKKKMKRRESKMKHRLKTKGEKMNKVKDHISADLTGANSPKSRFISPTKPIFNKEGKMVFSKFDFGSKPKVEKDKDAGKLRGNKKFKKLLEQVEQRKAKLAELREQDSEKAKITEEKDKWKNVLQKAEGIKVKDNPDLIKKVNFKLCTTSTFDYCFECNGRVSQIFNIRCF